MNTQTQVTTTGTKSEIAEGLRSMSRIFADAATIAQGRLEDGYEVTQTSAVESAVMLRCAGDTDDAAYLKDALQQIASGLDMARLLEYQALLVRTAQMSGQGYVVSS